MVRRPTGRIVSGLNANLLGYRSVDAGLGEGRLRGRAMLELAAAGGLVKGEHIATAQGIPQKFLETILTERRHAELVASRRGWRAATRSRAPPRRSASPM